MKKRLTYLFIGFRSAKFRDKVIPVPVIEFRYERKEEPKRRDEEYER